MLTILGLLKMISTAASSVKCSQNPSDAKIKNKSSAFNFRVNIDGSAVTTGLFKGTGHTNCRNRGLLSKNSGFFR